MRKKPDFLPGGTIVNLISSVTPLIRDSAHQNHFHTDNSHPLDGKFSSVTLGLHQTETKGLRAI